MSARVLPRATEYAGARLEPLLSLDQVGELLGVSRKTVSRLALAGELPTVRVGRSVRINPEDVRGYVERNREERGDQ
jgi:excisionase family DNA binding protein